MDKRVLLALKYYKEGFTCSQSVFCAYLDLMDLDLKTAYKIMEGMGGGIGGSQSICGALSGGVSVISYLTSNGLLNGSSKKETYFYVRKYIAEFNKRLGSTICKEILNGSKPVHGKCAKKVLDAVEALNYVIDLYYKEHYKLLPNGNKIPLLGLGTWKSPNDEITVSSVRYALDNGYTHIDTAAIYGNEKSVGEAIRLSKLKREDIFVTSKVWNTSRGYENTKKAFYKTLEDLGLDYLDLYLIHWPANRLQFENNDEINKETWRAMVELYKEGKIKAIGVSNFLIHHLKPLMEFDVTPMVNQIEYHIGYTQDELVNYCNENNIIIEAWSPLGNGKMLDNPILMKIANKHHKSVAQVLIRWCLDKGVVTLVKSVTPSRIKENLEIYDFKLDEEDLNNIKEIEETYFSGSNPDLIKF